jgi:predicted transport protein
VIWTCPACGREFGKRQSHLCAPAMSVKAYYAGRPAVEREIFEAVRAHLESLGPVIVEPVSIGILFKGKRTFVELRPKTKWVALSFGLNRRVEHPRITRTTRTNIGRTYHAIRVTSPADVDDTVRGWLTESYLELVN